MRTFQQSIDINRSPEALFDFMLDAAHAAEWRASISRMEWIDGGPRTNARALLVFWAEGKEQQQETTLVEFDRPRRYTLLNHNKGYRFWSANEIVPNGSGSRLTVTLDVVGDTLGASLLLPLIRMGHRKRFEDALARLKSAAEKRRD